MDLQNTYIGFDRDGTLEMTDHPAPEKLMSQFEQLQKRGTTLFIASGRSHQELQAMCHNIRLFAINVLKAALSKAVEWGVVKAHPFANIKAMTFDRSPKVRYLERAELLRLHAALKNRQDNPEMFHINEGNDQDEDVLSDYLEPMIIVSLNTGARRGELFNLTWDQVDLTEQTIGLLGKSQSIRYVPLNDDAFQALQTWRQKNQ